MKICGIDRRKLKKNILNSMRLSIKFYYLMGIEDEVIPSLILNYKERAIVYPSYYDIEDDINYVYLKYEMLGYSEPNTWIDDYEIIKNYKNITVNEDKLIPYKNLSIKFLKTLCHKVI